MVELFTEKIENFDHEVTSETSTSPRGKIVHFRNCLFGVQELAGATSG